MRAMQQMSSSPATKVIGQRVGAFLVDALLGTVLYWALVAALGENLGQSDDDSYRIAVESFDDEVLVQLGRTIYEFEAGRYFLVAAIMLAFWVALHVVLQGLTGVTPGKALFGIRTVREDGSPPGIGKALVRWLFLIADGFPYVLPMLTGFIVALTSSGNRRVGDMVAGTYVVRRAAAGQPVMAPAAPGPYAVYQPGPAGAPTAPGYGQGPGPVETGAGDQPRWDPARNTYIRWDEGQRVWLQWREAERRWVPIDS